MYIDINIEKVRLERNNIKRLLKSFPFILLKRGEKRQRNGVVKETENIIVNMVLNSNKRKIKFCEVH